MVARYRQRHAEPRAAPLRHADVNPSVVRVDDLPDDGEAQARPLRLGREERTEDPIDYVAWNARPVVADFDLHHGSLRLAARRTVFHQRVRLDGDVAPTAQRLERVGDQIGEDLP